MLGAKVSSKRPAKTYRYKIYWAKLIMQAHGADLICQTFNFTESFDDPRAAMRYMRGVIARTTEHGMTVATGELWVEIERGEAWQPPLQGLIWQHGVE